MIPTLCWSILHAVRHSATCRSMQKPCPSCIMLMFTLFLAFAVQQSHIVLHFANGIVWMHFTTSRFITCTGLSYHELTYPSVHSWFCDNILGTIHILTWISQPETFSSVKNWIITLHCSSLGTAVGVVAIVKLSKLWEFLRGVYGGLCLISE